MLLINLFYGLCLTLAFAFGATYKVPEALVEILSPKGLRISIPHQEGVVLVAFHANLNKDIEENEGGSFLSVDVNEQENGRWTYTNKAKRLKVGDVIYYWVYVDYFDGERKLGYKREGEIFTVTDSSSVPLPTGCTVSKTLVNGKNVCVGDVILEDTFSNSVIDYSKWMFEHRIPTYTGPKFEFNSYRNRDETRFIKNSNLYLQPIALTEEKDVRGTLDLREEGCTSTGGECLYVQGSSFLLPPVKSAKMNSLVNFKYGRIEIQAKLPAGDWIIPIIKLQPSGDNVQNGHTQIWIAYSRGNNHLYFHNRQISNDDIGSRVLFAGPVVESIEPTHTENLMSRKSTDPYYTDFHTYTLEWSPDSMKFYFDSQLFGSIPTSSQFSEEYQQYHLSLGVSVGGLNDFPDGYNISDTGAKPWENSERDYIKKFFVARNTWLQSWNDDNSALKIASVKILAV